MYYSRMIYLHCCKITFKVGAVVPGIIPSIQTHKNDLFLTLIKR